ncbi:MAG: CopG family transcriptional regulator [Candidatus Dormibacteraceae bacterium]
MSCGIGGNAVYYRCMHRTQIYLTEEQRQIIAYRALHSGISKAEVIRQILDRELQLSDGSSDHGSIVDATAGILADYPDWPEWLADVRGGGASERLRELGL